MAKVMTDVLEWWVPSQQHPRPRQFHVDEVLLRRETERERGRGIPLIYMENDVKMEGELNGFWKYGGHCLDNRSVGRAVAYVMS